MKFVFNDSFFSFLKKSYITPPFRVNEVSFQRFFFLSSFTFSNFTFHPCHSLRCPLRAKQKRPTEQAKERPTEQAKETY